MGEIIINSHSNAQSEVKNNSKVQQDLSKQQLQAGLGEIIQRAQIDPSLLTHAEVLQLHKTFGNKAVGRLFRESMPNTSKTIQLTEKDTNYSPYEKHAADKNFKEHMNYYITKELKMTPQDFSDNRGKLHTVINIDLKGLTREVAIFLYNLPDKKIMDKKGNIRKFMWMNTIDKYDYITYDGSNGTIHSKGNDYINLRLQLVKGKFYQAYHFQQMGKGGGY